MNLWLSLTYQAASLAWEAQGVMALRLMKLAGGGAAARSEAQGMIAEKVAAFAQAHAVASAAVLAGSIGPRTARRLLTVYKSKVRRNKRRLSG
jgi:hypothetical protein